MAGITTSSSLLAPKDPPSYDSLYLSIPSTSQQHLAAASNGRRGWLYKVRRSFYYCIPHFKRFLAACFVASTISTTVMLLLWQLQNLSTPEDPDRPWFDPDSANLPVAQQ